MNRLSAVIIAYNEEYNIGRCLASLQGLADEIVVVDSHSNDRTTEICSSFGARVFQHDFSGYSEQKQYAVGLASNDWILSIDADEEVTPGLKQSILEQMHADTPAADGFYVLRDLVYLGKRLKHGGTAGERILRVFNRRSGAFDGAAVHEKIIVKGTTAVLGGRLLHYSYRDLSHHLAKINEYTQKIAGDNFRKGKRFPKIWMIVKFKTGFFTFYILKGGILDGYAGFIWALMGSVYASLKISKTIEYYQNHQEA